MIIAVDGPSGSGKSSISKEIAKILNIEYLDTGAMYRLLALYLKENKLEFSIENMKNFNIDQRDNRFYLNEKEVTNDIRENDISILASNISTVKEVREFLVAKQREISKSKSIILDGRDITTVVFPNADFKIYLDADVEIRAKRRAKELQNIAYEKVLEDMKLRDYQDINRENSPLRISKDAIYIDTTKMTKEEVIEKILNIVKGV